MTDDAIAVELDLVEPLIARRRLLDKRGELRLDVFWNLVVAIARASGGRSAGSRRGASGTPRRFAGDALRERRAGAVGPCGGGRRPAPARCLPFATAPNAITIGGNLVQIAAGGHAQRRLGRDVEVLLVAGEFIAVLNEKPLRLA